MAIELRKLLCDKNHDKDQSLLPCVVSDPKLPKLHITKVLENCPSLLVGLEHIMPGSISVIDGKRKFELLFSDEEEWLGIEEWIDQIFFDSSITIKELIKSVADKEAAHSDLNYNDTLNKVMDWSYGNVACHIFGIYGISLLLYDIFAKMYPEITE